MREGWGGGGGEEDVDVKAVVAMLFERLWVVDMLAVVVVMRSAISYAWLSLSLRSLHEKNLIIIYPLN